MFFVSLHDSLVTMNDLSLQVQPSEHSAERTSVEQKEFKWITRLQVHAYTYCTSRVSIPCWRSNSSRRCKTSSLLSRGLPAKSMYTSAATIQSAYHCSPFFVGMTKSASWRSLKTQNKLHISQDESRKNQRHSPKDNRKIDYGKNLMYRDFREMISH
jgi:hypothetical protein